MSNRVFFFAEVTFRICKLKKSLKIIFMKMYNIFIRYGLYGVLNFWKICILRSTYILIYSPKVRSLNKYNFNLSSYLRKVRLLIGSR